jgi:hypothetical protein
MEITDAYGRFKVKSIYAITKHPVDVTKQVILFITLFLRTSINWGISDTVKIIPIIDNTKSCHMITRL